MDQEAANVIVAAIRNEDNTDNLILAKVKIDGVESFCLCWQELGDENNTASVSPLAVLVSPDLFEKLSDIII